MRRWGSGTRNVFDTKPINAIIFRYFCVDCSRTFRYYPQGLDRSQLSTRIRRLAALLWLMDVSTREVEEILENLGVSINRMTVWREGQRLLDELSQKKMLSQDTHYKICRSNGNGCHGYSFSICLEFRARLRCWGCSTRRNSEGVVTWLRGVLAEQEIEILDLNEFDFTTAELLYVPL